MKKIIKKVKENRLVNNFIVLLTGEGIGSVFSMLSFAIIIAAIGNEGNGMIISVQTYCILINSVFGFKSFQALIKYISNCIEKKDNNKIEEYIYQSYILDIAAVILATVFSFIFLGIYAKIMGWNLELIWYAKIYIIAFVFQIQGTPLGILRGFNRFNYITYNNVINAFFRLLLYSLGLVMNFEFEYFFFVETILVISQNIILNLLAYKTLKKNDLNKFYKRKIKIEKRFFMFNLYSNIASTIDIPVGTLTQAIINKYLGYADLSAYKAFEKIGSMIGKLGSPLSQIIYPEMNLLIARKEYKAAKRINDKLFIGISLIGCFMIIGTLVTYRFWLGYFIDGYQEYVISLILYLIFIVFVNGTVGVHSLFMALNYIRYTVPILLFVNILYLMLIYSVIKPLKLNGVILSLLIQAIAVVIIKVVMMKKNSYKEIY